MAKVKGPLLSLSATGQIGQSHVYASWRGVPYARRYVVPANPRTTAQTLTRNTFQFADDQFKRMLTLAQSPWKQAEKGRPATARNFFIASFVRNLRGSSDFSAYEASPGVNGGLPLKAFNATEGASSGEIDVDIDIPPLPVDWTHDAVIVTAFLDRAPDAQMTDFAEETEITQASWSVGPPPNATDTLTGLNTGALYVVSAFLRSTRADGKIAYGIGSTALVNAA